jgi:hypothetical protein
MTAREFEPTTVIVVLLLFLSLWSVYEIGYMDNDICAQKFETDPVFTDEARGFPYKGAKRGAWIWALILGGIGCLFVPHRSWPISFGLWVLVLSVTRGVYYLFNRIDKKTRVWLHLMLQICREAPFILIVPVGAVGIMACIAQIITRWQQYFIYRYIRAFDVSAWPELEFRTIRLLLFTVLCSLLFVSEQSIDLWAWPTAAIFGWCVFLARTEIALVIKRAYRIDVNGCDIRPSASASGRAPDLELNGDAELVTAQGRRR